MDHLRQFVTKYVVALHSARLGVQLQTSLIQTYSRREV